MLSLTVRHTNNLLTSTPDNDNPDLYDLRNRFINEKELTRSENRCHRVMLPLLFAVTVVGTLALCHAAVAVVSVELMLIAFAVGCIACAYLFNQWQLLAVHERRLHKEIFEELLLADGPELTKRKIEIFEEFGHECRELRMPDSVSIQGNPKNIRIGVLPAVFFEWGQNAIRTLEKEGSSYTSEENYKIESMVTLLNELKVAFENEREKSWDKEDDAGFVALANNLALCRDQFNLSNNDQSTENTSEDGLAAKDEIYGLIGKASNTVVWKVEDLNTILGHCPNITRLFITKVFDCKDIFEQYQKHLKTSTQLKIWIFTSYSAKQIPIEGRIDSFKTIQQQFDELFLDKITFPFQNNRPRRGHHHGVSFGSPRLHSTRHRSNSRSSSPPRTIAMTPSKIAAIKGKLNNPWTQTKQPGFTFPALPETNPDYKKGDGTPVAHEGFEQNYSGE